MAKIYEAVKIGFDQIDQNFIRDWIDLIGRCTDPNAYLDPAFVLSALKYLKHKRITIVALYHVYSEQRILVGLGVFEFYMATFRHPFPQFQAYKSTHSPLSGLLIDRDMTFEIVSFLMKYLGTRYWYMVGVRFRDFPTTDALGQVLGQFDKGKWTTFWDYRRAVYTIPEERGDSWSGEISKKRLASYRKSLRDMEKLGALDWQIISSSEVSESTVADFLRVEHSGWKGEKGTSLLSNSRHTQFFKETIEQLRERQQVFFSELRLNGKLIAGTCNFISGNKAFAFKIGWDIDYKKYSPGIVCVIEFLRHTDKKILNLYQFESGSTGNSFIDHYWHERWDIADGFFAFNGHGVLIIRLLETARQSIKSVIRLLKIK